MKLNTERKGTGAPLVLVHGLGSSLHSWDLIVDDLALERETIAIDLPGFGETPPLDGEVSIATLADSVTSFLEENDLRSADLVGSSMGARLVLELARRGIGGATVALSPGGFWSKNELRYFNASLAVSIRLVRALQAIVPRLANNPVARTALLPQLSHRPWDLPPELVERELRSLAASPSFDEALAALVDGPAQEGAPAGSTPGPLTIGWGRNDRIVLPRQAGRAVARFPGAKLHWFAGCGHFPQWDQPQEATRLILSATG